jgi:GcrA cell cycle regulator
MQSTNWPPEHSDALREYLGRRMSFSEITQAINARFNAVYSRSAVIGRATRIGLASANRTGGRLKPPPIARQPGPDQPRERDAAMFFRPMPVFEPVKPVKLRCVEIVPRHISFLDLEPNDCRYPYGGDEEGEAVTFCAHPRRPGSSYCAPHLHLTRGPGTASERAAVAVLLRVVEGGPRANPLGRGHGDQDETIDGAVWWR